MYTSSQISAYHHRKAQAHYRAWKARAETNRKRALAIKAGRARTAFMKRRALAIKSLNKLKARFRGYLTRKKLGYPNRSGGALLRTKRNLSNVFVTGKRRRT